MIGQGLADSGPERFVGVDGPEAILAGSCSSATLAQLERHVSGGHPAMALDIAAILDGRLEPENAAGFVQRNSGRAPLVHSTAAARSVGDAQARFGREIVAAHLDAFFGETARLLVEGGLRRLVVAGGETSGAIVTALGLRSMQIGPEIDVGVPALRAGHGAQLALALKSGNFGSVDFFAKALAALEGEHERD